MAGNARAMMPDLQAISRQGGSDFSVALGAAGVLHDLSVVRRVPGKRIVCRGLWQGHPVFAKLFIGRKAARYAARDAAGISALLQGGIATPELLYRTALGDTHVLVLAAVENSRNAEAVWREQAADPAARQELARKLVLAVAGHHRQGLLQRDLYLRNFLLQGDRVLTLDGDGVGRLGRWSARRDALDNLALLLSKFDADDDGWIAALLSCYADAQGWTPTVDQLARVQRSVMTQRLRAAHRYAARKVFRNCTDVAVRRDWQGFMAISRSHDSAALRAQLACPDAALTDPATQMLKNGNTCTVYMPGADARQTVVKRYNIKNWRHAIGRFCRPSRAAASWANAHRLHQLGVATAAPLALLERRFGCLRRQAYFIAEYVPAPHALAFFNDAAVSPQRKQQAARNIAHLMHKLWRLQLVHGDMKATNLLMDANDQPVLLDLDALRATACRWRLRRGHIRDLRRWMSNWAGDPVLAGWMRDALRQVYKNEGPLLTAAIEKSENR